MAVGEDERSRMGFVFDTINDFKGQKKTRDMLDAKLYYWGENPTINRYEKMVYDLEGKAHPDMYTANHMPLAMQIYNHYRKHWLAAYWQQCGIHVVPTLCWSNKQSYEWCFDGEPQHSIVAISSVGTQKSKQNQALFEKGVRAALARLEPSEILWYGKCPEEFDWNVTRIQPYYKRVRRISTLAQINELVKDEDFVNFFKQSFGTEQKA